MLNSLSQLISTLKLGCLDSLLVEQRENDHFFVTADHLTGGKEFTVSVIARTTEAEEAFRDVALTLKIGQTVSDGTLSKSGERYKLFVFDLPEVSLTVRSAEK